MNTPDRTRAALTALGAVLLALGPLDCSLAQEPAGSGTILGESNPLLADGSTALQAGRVEEGVRLTLEGLKTAAGSRDLTAGHSNACAGLVLLERLDEALDHCNQAISLDAENWHAYNNRAAIFAAKGWYDLALRDLKTGLALAPWSDLLKKSMSIVQMNQKLMLKHAKKSVLS